MASLFEAFGSQPVNPNDLAVARAAQKTDPFVTEQAASELPFAVFDAAKQNRIQNKREKIYAEAEQKGLNPYDTPQEFYKYMSKRMLEEGDAKGSMRVQQMLEDWRVNQLNERKINADIADKEEITAGRKQEREIQEEVGLETAQADLDFRKAELKEKKAEIAEIPADALSDRKYKRALGDYYKALTETAGMSEETKNKIVSPKTYHIDQARELVLEEVKRRLRNSKDKAAQTKADDITSINQINGAGVIVADVAAALSNPGTFDVREALQGIGELSPNNTGFFGSALEILPGNQANVELEDNRDLGRSELDIILEQFGTK